MALSRSARIIFLLAIDVVFLFIELTVGMSGVSVPRPILIITGYAVGSLALVADSFHMLKSVYLSFSDFSPIVNTLLSDVMSLVVALYAIKLTANSSADSSYSYGWHRAEILAALINGVFLLALCFSIFLEAIERFFSKPGMSLEALRNQMLTDTRNIQS
ncbi:hypothetical protein C0993_007556 [Termitomyces sp. T159_Od127]|nr:hypothetical protein C0993_007556 [Termitomyces sp. T159_Od127]